MLQIDGSMGEGGGQVLRTALALSAVTRTPFRIGSIRGRRQRPGLLRQHLTAVRAMAEICGAQLTGDELGSTTLTFEPKTTRHGDYHFAVGTAGSATLVLQTILPPLLISAGSSHIVFEGGTHNPKAPPFDFIAQTFIPILRRMGANVSAELERPGFHPAGGGRFVVTIVGGQRLVPLALLARGPVEKVCVTALLSQVPEHVAARELKTFAAQLADVPVITKVAQVESPGPGNAVVAVVQSEHISETFCGTGERGVRAETVARRLAGNVRKYVYAEVPVGPYLADQLLIPMALARGGEILTGALSLHTRTNIEVIQLFLPIKFTVTEIETKRFHICTS